MATSGDPDNLVVMLGRGDRTFEAPRRFLFEAALLTSSSSAEGGKIAVADLNGDGKPDVAIANEVTNGVWILLQR